MAFKIEVTDECIGCGACVATCADCFEMDGDKAKAKNAEVEEAGCCNEAAEACPVNCIKINEMQ